ncbi:hypothetical protein PIB30_047547 [Stylosanthes scabra]|uniref:Uncharacterized protein n=1 Tax=Stylosanthes scabra TaxID=79078 RepID=A0ABU6SGQ9_9FABA|nr:hypothetical protein [Stylosanthes scabra]
MRESESGGVTTREKHGEGGSRVEEGKDFKVFFRDKVVGGDKPKLLVLHDLLDGDKLAVVIGRKDESSRPSVTFSNEGLQALTEPYVNSIVVRKTDKLHGPCDFVVVLIY